MNQNTIDSLRRLAERPGTEHEGIVAREMLKRLEAKRSEGFRDYELEYLALFRRHMRGEITLHEFLRSSRSQTAEPWTCPCGDTIYMNGKCLNQLRHLEVQTEIRSRFKRGDRAYYNYWAYPENCPCEVQAFVKLQRDNGTFPWAWISVKFDHLKNTRQIPILSAKGWHLSKEPLTEEECGRMANP